MKRTWINAVAAIVILMGASSLGVAQEVAPMQRAICESGDGAASCNCSGACWADGSSCGCR
jgi:hypothetical protein